MTYKNHYFFFCLVLIWLALNTENSLAQPIINLTDIAKIEFVTRPGFVGTYYKRVEVLPEDNSWKCYQTRLMRRGIRGSSDDTSRIYLNNAPTEILIQLLTAINNADSSINIRRFNINTNELISSIDKVNPDLKPDQKNELIKAIWSEDMIQAELEKILHSPSIADANYLSITITTKTNLSLSLSAYGGTNTYYLPWKINNIKCYDPSISIIFESILGSNTYPTYERERLSLDITRRVYWTHFKTRFNFNDLKTDHPLSFDLLRNTLTPANFSLLKGTYIGYFKSSLLPQYVQIRTFFKPDDIAEIEKVKRFESILATCFGKENFLFTYLKERPDCIMIMAPEQMDERGKDIIRYLKPSFPEISKFDYLKIQFIDIRGNPDIESKWLLLPDNTLILCEYRGIQQKNNDIKFMNIPSGSLINDKLSKEVCILFDSSGKIIHNYGSLLNGFPF